MWELEVGVDPLTAEPADVFVADSFAVAEVGSVFGSAHIVTALLFQVVCVPVR